MKSNPAASSPDCEAPKASPYAMPENATACRAMAHHIGYGNAKPVSPPATPKAAKQRISTISIASPIMVNVEFSFEIVCRELNAGKTLALCHLMPCKPTKKDVFFIIGHEAAQVFSITYSITKGCFDVVLESIYCDPSTFLSEMEELQAVGWTIIHGA